VRICVIIPCFNHSTTVAAVVRGAEQYCPVLLVDDGSTQSLSHLNGIEVIRLAENRGKGAALRAGFQRAAELGFTHAITMDADGQHSIEDLPNLIAAARQYPEALILGVRDFLGPNVPAGRRRSNAVSSFWFGVETGVRLPDTQCGFRCYPVELTQRLRVRSQRYAFELEFMVRSAWTGVAIVPVVVQCIYQPKQSRQSHFRPVLDLTRITLMNIGLVLQSWVVPQRLRAEWSLGTKATLRQTIRGFFSEHSHDPARLAFAVGLGLFCGIAPIWGYQMLVAVALAHFLRLNKAITLVASNISIPPVMPFILFGGLALGHWLFTGHWLDLSPREMTRARSLEYVWQWCVGSLVLGTVVAMFGSVTTYLLARFLRHR